MKEEVKPSGFFRIVKQPTSLKKCPICKTPLINWGDLTNYYEKTIAKMWRCPKCMYERLEYEGFKNDEG